MAVPQQPLVPSIWPVGLRLSASEAQNLRHCESNPPDLMQSVAMPLRSCFVRAGNIPPIVRRCRMALTAVNEAGRPPLIDMVLPLGSQNLSILHGLLALSLRASDRSPQDLQHHQVALSELHAEISTAQVGAGDLDRLRRLLSLSMLLCIFTIPQCDGAWVQHTRGMVSLIRSSDHAALAQTPLGEFLLAMCCFQDLAAFGIGRGRLSQTCWLSWMSCRVGRGRPDGTLSALEVTSGYPESLLDLIARASELAENRFHLHMQNTLHGAANHLSPTFSNMMAIVPSDDVEAALVNWRMPSLPRAMSPFQQLALRIAWQTLQKATLLYSWRGHGFHANLISPVRADRADKVKKFVAEMLNDIEAIIEMGRSHNLSIGNSMLWPTTIIACESLSGGADAEERRQRVIKILEDIQQLYSMDHPPQLARVLRHLWDQATQLPPSPYLSLEQVCGQLEMTIALF